MCQSVAASNHLDYVSYWRILSCNRPGLKFEINQMNNLNVSSLVCRQCYSYCDRTQHVSQACRKATISRAFASSCHLQSWHNLSWFSATNKNIKQLSTVMVLTSLTTCLPKIESIAVCRLASYNASTFTSCYGACRTGTYCLFSAIFCSSLLAFD